MRQKHVLFLLVVVIGVSYLPGLFNGFVWLDHGEIEHKTLIVKDIRDLARIFLHDRNYAGYHRPLYNLLHTLDLTLWGMKPFGFHLSSLLLHLINVLLVFTVMFRCGMSKHSAWIVTLLWGLHPIHTAVVGLIHAKADLFVVTVLLAAYLLVNRPYRTRTFQVLGHGFSLLFLTLALFTKETAFLYPIFIAVVGMFSWKHPAHQRNRSFSLYLGSIVMVTVIVGLLRLSNTPAGTYTSKCTLVERLLTFSGVYTSYLFTLFLPVNLSICDTVTRFPTLSLPTQIGNLSMCCLLIGGQLLLAYSFKRLRGWIFLYNLALLPVAQIVPILHFRADRFLYMPGMACVAIVVECASMLLMYARKRQVIRDKALPSFLFTIVGLIAVCFMSSIVSRLRDFHHDETLFQSELIREPDYKEGLLGLALYYDTHSAFTVAESFYQKCLEPTPHKISYVDSDTLIVNYARNLLKQNKVSAAYEFIHANMSFVLHPRTNTQLAYILAEAAVKLERYEQAFPILMEYCQEFPDDPDGQFLLGVLEFARICSTTSRLLNKPSHTI